MAELCSSFPTLTSTQEVRTQIVRTTVSNVISTIPASTFSVTTTVACGNSSCPPVVVQTESSAQIVTTQIPVTLTSQINTFVVSTLWGTTCTRSGSGFTSPTLSSTATLSLDRAASTSATLTPVAETSSSLTSLAPGRLSTQLLSGALVPTKPDSVSPSQTLVVAPTPTDLLPTTTTTATDSSQSQSTNWGPLVGGVIGGAICLCALAVIIWHLLRRKRKRADAGLDIFFEKLTPPLRQHQRSSDEGSSSSRQPFWLKETRSTRNPWNQDRNYDRQIDEVSSPMPSFQSSHHSALAGHHFTPDWLQVDPSSQLQYLHPSSTHHHQWNAINGQPQG